MISLQNAGCALLITIAFLGCAGAPVASISPLDANRQPASIMEAYGLNCLLDTEVLRSLPDKKNDAAALTDDREIARAFSKLKGEARTKALALALAESYAYGQKLLADFDALLKRRLRLDEIRRTSNVYAELNALYFIRHELQAAAGNHFASDLLKRLENGKVRDSARGIRLVQDAVTAHLDSLRREIAARNGDSRYAVLALAEVETAFDELGATAGRCGFTQALDATFNSRLAVQTREARVFSAAKALPKSSDAYRSFRPRNGEGGLSITELVRRRGKEIRRAWNPAPARTPQSAARKDGKIIYPDPGKPGNIFGRNFPVGVWALTFDDGPHGGTSSVPSYTSAVLENLERHQMKATFFILAQNVERADCANVGPRTVGTRIYDIRKSRPLRVFPDLAIAERDQGHAVESHSYYHSEIPKDDDAERACEISEAPGVLTRLLGTAPGYFRLPYGAGVNSVPIRTKIAQANLVHVYWTVDTLDWQDHDPDSIVRRALLTMKNEGRGVILFHDVHPQSVIASEKIMTYLKDPANHLESVTIPEIVDRMNAERQ